MNSFTGLGLSLNDTKTLNLVFYNLVLFGESSLS